MSVKAPSRNTPQTSPSTPTSSSPAQGSNTQLKRALVGQPIDVQLSMLSPGNQREAPSDGAPGKLGPANHSVLTETGGESGFKYTGIVGRHARATHGPHAPKQRTERVIWLKGKDGCGGYLTLSWNYDGHNIDAYHSGYEGLSGLGGVLGGAATAKFSAQPTGDIGNPVTEVLVSVRGRFNPPGRGDTDYEGHFIIKGDGTIQMIGLSLPTGDGKALPTKSGTMGIISWGE